MAKLFQPIRFWIARFICRKSSASSGSSCPSRPSPGLQPATRMVAGFRLPVIGPPCIHEAHFRHRGAPVSGSQRPSATVAAWHPGPAAPLRGKASVRLLACVRLHPRPRNGLSHKFLPIFPASTGPASFLADPDHASVVRNSNKVRKEAATAPEASGSGRCRGTIQFVFSS